MCSDNRSADNNGGPTYMPVGKEVRPVPEVMTENEVIQFLRLDVDGPQSPQQTLQYYREKGLLKGTRIGKRLRYCRPEVLKFLQLQTNQTNKHNIAM